MALAFIAVGSWMFWSLLVLTAIILAILVEEEKGGYAFGTLVVAVAAIVLFSDLQVEAYLKTHYTELLVYLTAYLIGGCVWPIFKWYFFVLKKLDQYKEAKQRFLKSKFIEGDTIPEEMMNEFKNRVGELSKSPKVIDNKGRILLWMSYWPLSFVYTVVNDPFRRLFLAIYGRLGGFLQRVSDRLFRDVNQEFGR